MFIICFKPLKLLSLYAGCLAYVHHDLQTMTLKLQLN